MAHWLSKLANHLRWAEILPIMEGFISLMHFTVHPISINTHGGSLGRLLNSLHSVDGSHFSCWIKLTKWDRWRSGGDFVGRSSIAVFLKRTSGFDLVNKHRVLGRLFWACECIQPHAPGCGNVLLWTGEQSLRSERRVDSPMWLEMLNPVDFLTRKVLCFAWFHPTHRAHQQSERYDRRAINSFSKTGPLSVVDSKCWTLTTE